MIFEPSPSGTIQSTPIAFCGKYFRGFALYPHLCISVSPDGYRRRIRSPFAEKLFQTLFNGDTGNMEEIAEIFSRGIITLFGNTPFDCLLIVPPPTSRRNYAPAIRLMNSISSKSGILSLQYAIRQIQNRSRSDQAEFCFTSETVNDVYTGKNIIVITDFFRSGRTLRALTTFLAENGKAASVFVLAGTIIRKE